MHVPYILPYTVEAYSDFYRDEFITSFTHSSLAAGQIDLEYGLKLVEKLSKEACRVMPCISFNQAMLTGNQLEGGACSAITFRVAKEALTLLKNRRQNQQLKPTNKEIGFALRFSRFIHHLEEIAISKRVSDKVVQNSIRTEQAAFNTIVVDRDRICSGSAVAEKVGAMAPFYGLRVVESTPQIRVKGNEQLETQLLEQLSSLKEGVYFLRIIQEKYNHKLEEKGHSSVYVKTGDAEYNFDPALGSYILFSEASKTNLIYNALLSANQRFGVDVLSIHRLEEETPVSSDPFDVPDLSLKGVIYSPCSSVVNLPIVIFSPGLGVSIDNYKAMAEGLCKKGFVVMSVDHPGTGLGTLRLEESAIIACGIKNGSNIEKLVGLIRNGHFAKIPANVRIAVMGHSLGGSASIDACRRTSEIVAAINMDGRIIDPSSVFQPVMQVVAKRVKEDRSHYNAALVELAKINPLLIRIEIEARHGEFSSSETDFQITMIDQYADFLNKYLVNGDKK